MKSLVLFFLAIGLTAPRVEAAPTPTVVYLVRHAEKASQPAADPPLTTSGRSRARALATLMAQAQPVAVIHTQFLRTRQTANPTVTSLNIPAVLIARDADPVPNAQAIVAKIRQQYSGKTTLVVGHSDTVPAIISRLGVANPPTISESQFNRLFKVTTTGLWPWTRTTMVETTYGR